MDFHPIRLPKIFIAANYKWCSLGLGFILGPILFLLYIIDKFSSSIYLSFILFADDSKIFFKHEYISELCDTVNRELSLVAYWFKGN